jgi:hypothetical protein
MRGQVSFSVAVVAMLGAGCGGGGGGGPTFSTSVPSGSAVNTLTPAQLTQLCNDIASFTSKELPSTSSCQAATVAVVAQQAASNSGLSDAELQLLCVNEMSVVCSVLAEDAGVAGSPDGGASSCGSGANCTATVGQITTCLNDRGAATARYESMFPACSAVTRAKLAAINFDAGIAEPASCTALQSTCPSFSSSMP